MPKIVVVIPSFRVKRHIADVIRKIGDEVALIFVIDDACPEGSGAYVEDTVFDDRVRVVRHNANQGVGGAVLTGYQLAYQAGADVIVKIDGDGQMDPALIPRFAAPILSGVADYCKGNRFYNVRDVQGMPPLRIFGNAALSFLTKASSGYWGIFDPTNGYTAISGSLVAELPLHDIRRRYFFESDILFQLGMLKAVVIDVPMTAVYADEVSGLRIGRILPQFLYRNVRNFCKRVFYSYFVRDFNAASIELLFGIAFLLFGTTFGAVGWTRSAQTGHAATTGTVMVAVLPVIVGVQLILSFLNFDTASSSKTPLHRLLLQRGQLELGKTQALSDKE